MALIKTPTDYERTGGNWFHRMANRSSYIPIPGLNTVLTNFFGWTGTIIDSGKWLLKGKVKSAITAFGAGAVDTGIKTVATAGGALSPLYWANVGSGVLTGKSIGTHARKGTEVIEGSVLGLVGQKPKVLQSYTAGIGSIAPTPGPGAHLRAAAASRGEDPNAAYARLQSGQPDHMAALQSAQQGYGRGM